MTRPRPLPEQLSTAFTTRDALGEGVHRERLRRQDLVSPYRGVHVRRDADLTLELRCTALLERIPGFSRFCGPTAAALLGMPLPRHLELAAVVHVAVPAAATAPVGRGVRGHSIDLTPNDTMVHRGLPITRAARTWCDLASFVGLEDLVASGDFVIHWRSPLATIEDLAQSVTRAQGRRGVRNMRAGLALLDGLAESPRESRLRVILIRGGVAGLAVNLPITTSTGYRYRADLAIPEYKVIVEYQGAYHFTSEQALADMTRKSRLAADGWVIIEVNKSDLTNPAELVARVRLACITNSRR